MQNSSTDSVHRSPNVLGGGAVQVADLFPLQTSLHINIRAAEAFIARSDAVISVAVRQFADLFLVSAPSLKASPLGSNCLMWS